MVEEINKILKKEYPEVKCSLIYRNAFELLVSTILSAQCTDERVNKTTPELFKIFPTPEDFAKADISDIENRIHSTGFYKAKAKNIQNLSKILVEKFNSKVPDSMKDLITLPGVARKTANVVLYNAFNLNEGIAVDTHVNRVSNRLGIVDTNNPLKIEFELMTEIPKNDWGNFSLLLIQHGRNVCKAKKPDCVNCILNTICPSAFKA